MDRTEQLKVIAQLAVETGDAVLEGTITPDKAARRLVGIQAAIDAIDSTWDEVNALIVTLVDKEEMA